MHLSKNWLLQQAYLEYRILIAGRGMGAMVMSCRQTAVLLTNYDITTVFQWFMIQWSWSWWSLYRKQPSFGAMSVISCKSSFWDVGLNIENLVLLYTPDVCECIIMAWQLYCLFNSPFSSQQRKLRSSSLLALCGGMHRWLIYSGHKGTA